MKNKKRMLVPDNSWDAGTMESWLEDMAAEGWYLTECWGSSARFRRGEPKRVRYRMIPAPNETYAIRQEREALYEELGWRFVANRWDFQVYVCEDPYAPELETDPVAAAWAWKRILNKERRNLILGWLLLVEALIFLARAILRSEAPVELLIRGAGVIALLVLLVLPWAVWWTVDTLRSIRLLRRQMAAGLPRPHTGDWRRAHRRAKVSRIVLLLMELLVIGYPFLQWGASWGEGLDELTHPVPCLMGWQLDNSLTEADRTSGTCLMNPTFLNPGHYDVWDDYPGDRSVTNQCDILLFSFLAEPLYREWQNRIPEFTEAELTELDHPGFDGVSLAQAGEDTYLLMWQDRIVLYVGAFGVSGAEDHLDDYAALLAEFQ